MLAAAVGVAVGSSELITPDWTTMPMSAITAMRNTTGKAMRATMRVGLGPAAGRVRERGARWDDPMGRCGRLVGGALKESTTGTGGSGAASSESPGALAEPIDSSRRRASSGSSTPPASAGGAPAGDAARGRRVLFFGVSSVTDCPGGRCA